MAPKLPNQLTASNVFKSLVKDARPWNLTRTLHSDNPSDLQGDLQGTASFKPRRNPDELLYDETGNMESVGGTMAGVRWSRKYIWRLSSPMKAEPALENGIERSADIGVWFVKLAKRPSEGAGNAETENDDEDEVDYIFHNLDFHDEQSPSIPEAKAEADYGTPCLIGSPPLDPPPVSALPTKVISAQGHHLCVNDVYETTYAFRVVDNGLSDVLSWASRHIVRGPKKNQSIVNMYMRQEI